MRKLLIFVNIEVVLWAGVVVIDMSGLASLYNFPVVGSILGLSFLLLLALVLPDIRAWLDPNKRIIRQGKERAKKTHETRLEVHIQAARNIKILRNITYDPATDRTSGDIVPRSWKGRFLRRLAWLPNHHIMPASVYIWIVKRLGWKIREPREGELEKGQPEV